MKARLTRNYTAPPEWGQFAYAAGLVVTGQLAMWALKDGAGVLVEPEINHKVVFAPEVKADEKPRRGRPPKMEAA